MNGFLIGAACLLAFALACVLIPLLRAQRSAVHADSSDNLALAVLRDQLRELDAQFATGATDANGYASARQDLERRVAEEIRVGTARRATSSAHRWGAPLLGLALPIAAAVLYLLLGTPLALKEVPPAGLETVAHDADKPELGAMVDRLAERLKSQPDNTEGWHMLARSYNALERHQEASEAYAHLLRLLPDDAGILADYADTLAMLGARSLKGEPEQLVERALALDPDHIKAIALSGTAAFERGNYAQAIERWRRIMRLAPADSEVARSTASSIAAAEKLMGATDRSLSRSTAQTNTGADRADAEPARLAGTVDVDPAVRAKVAQDATVFIFARAPDGPRMPLAVLRKRVQDLPATFVLDDSMNMRPDIRLSGHSHVMVGARISMSGSATPGAGDFETYSAPVPLGTRDLELRISLLGRVN